MARGNGDFARCTVLRLATRFDDRALRIAEIGSGPGVGLEAALATFPSASVVGVDPSKEMLTMARRRNRVAVADGRLMLVEGEAAVITAHGPFDLVFCTHVLYFWKDPVRVLGTVRSAVRAGGLVGIGYQLARDMPAISREQFPALGHRVYETDEQVDDALVAAGFSIQDREFKGPADAPHGRLVVAGRQTTS